MKLQQVHGKIWIGPGEDVERMCRERDWSTGETLGILNVADDYNEYSHQREVLYIHAGLNDGPEDWGRALGEHNSVAAYVQAVMALDYLVYSRDVVYIHCHGGVSRSGIVSCLYWAEVYSTIHSVIVDTEAIQARVKRKYERINIHPKHFDIEPSVRKYLLKETLKIDFLCYDYWEKLGEL